MPFFRCLILCFRPLRLNPLIPNSRNLCCMLNRNPFHHQSHQQLVSSMISTILSKAKLVAMKVIVLWLEAWTHCFCIFGVQIESKSFFWFSSVVHFDSVNSRVLCQPENLFLRNVHSYTIDAKMRSDEDSFDSSVFAHCLLMPKLVQHRMRQWEGMLSTIESRPMPKSRATFQLEKNELSSTTTAEWMIDFGTSKYIINNNQTQPRIVNSNRDG